MNNTSDVNQSPAPGENQPEGGANPQTSSQHGRCVFEPLSSAVGSGARRAKAAAEEAIPKVKAAVADATYWFGFSLSFAAVFSYTIIKELAPEVLKKGFHEGAQAGRKSAEEMVSESKAQPDAPGATPSLGSDPAGRAPQPGAA